MAKPIQHNCTQYHISGVHFYNGANCIANIYFDKSFSTWGIQSHSRFNNSSRQGRFSPLQNEVFSVPADLLLNEGDKFTLTIEITDATGVKAHAFTFVYSRYSDAYASINTLDINNNNILWNTLHDHFANHVKRIVLENKGAYVAKLRVHYYNSKTKETGSKTSGSMAVGKSKFWDGITELHLPNNSYMYPEVVVVWGKNKKCDSKLYYVRQDSTRVVTYRCKGTTLKPTISEV
ncbi:hypothetical protein Fisuc_2601 [Fibrobacter succinogenes subsp. succinogenes S85]|uniref:Uncharacterized protein n=2 Tax=Fibrobacter succinogenes TaxID=833 RepID=A0ABM5LL95_FIBSS|nr:hypothetical protein Fisuc_2601 [Fibrobacter succinogenes subsp. succinogenes S85]